MKSLIKVAVFGAIIAAVFFVADSVSAATVQFHLRFQSEVFFEGPVDFPDEGVSQITATNHTTGLEENREVNSRSILALLSSIDASSDAFRISTLEYYPEYGSLYIKCFEVTAESPNACDNWQYVVNGEYSYVGMDNYILTGDENVWIYFGDIRLVTPGEGSHKTDQPFSFTAEQYQYEVHGWAPATGYTIGVKKGEEVVATQLVDENGRATFTVSEEGNYVAGIVEDFYFPKTPFFVARFVPSFGPSGSAAPPPSPEPQPEKLFDVESAIQFLESLQVAGGSLGDVSMLNDWVAIAGLDIKNYLLLDPNPGTLLTDYERRAMALMALGINPYSGTPTNYIEKILKEFDGTQFGNKDLVNDDVFALLSLVFAGYTVQDLEVQNTVAFMLSFQQPNGSWSDVDMTAAAVQALEPISSSPGVQEALTKAKTYLESKEDETGSFGNAYSTSWALQALSALGENVSSSSLADLQADDGGLLQSDSLNNRIWATAYAIPAAQGKSWSSILQSFQKPALNLVGPSSAELGPTKLLAIQQEVEKIELALTVLEPQIALLYNQYLAVAQEEQRVAGLPAGQAGITQEIARVQNEIAVLQSQNPAGEILETEVPEEESGVVAITQQEPPANEVASVESAFPTSGGLGSRQIVLLVIAGFAIFLLAGGTNLVSPFLRKIIVRMQ
ncbi:MAG: hypothetical protein A3J57_01180 [Candidatus Wildermuthbacteria bacterium RIFCSPHIGHO2_02_FULL_49_12b]|nr:MAG: hypothetical protein A3J57_01180 [Candidatus Wildermuthbacteria bacterium RIFCSPHIGHO2_02_FULL_49_12b]